MVIGVAAGDPLERAEIGTGMDLAKTVYAVFMALGLKVAAEALYPALFAREKAEVGSFSPSLVLGSFLVILCLAIRFSWIPRNLYEYVRRHLNGGTDAEMTRASRLLMLCHFPIALVHTLLFFGVCEAFAEMTEHSNSSLAPVLHFVCISTALLVLNSFWLLFLLRRNDAAPDHRFWAKNNLICALLVAALVAAYSVFDFSVAALLVGALVIFFFNSMFDLVVSADGYVRFEV